ncbi:hypothetical protein D3C75_1054020 [compost metagenome]
MLNMPEDILNLRLPAIPDKPGDKSHPDPPVHRDQCLNLLIAQIARMSAHSSSIRMRGNKGAHTPLRKLPESGRRQMRHIQQHSALIAPIY